MCSIIKRTHTDVITKLEAEERKALTISAPVQKTASVALRGAVLSAKRLREKVSPKATAAQATTKSPSAKKRKNDSNNLLSQNTETIGSKEGWTKVRKKPSRKRNGGKSIRTRSDAIVIEKKSKDVTYADMLRKVKNSVEFKDLGEKVKTMRPTQKGGLLIELKRSKDVETASYHTAFENALKDVAIVNVKTHTITIQCKGLIPGLTTNEELLSAIAEQAQVKKPDESSIKSRRNTHGGTESVYILLYADDAKKVLTLGHCVTARSIKWRVDESIYTHTDHLAIVIEIGGETQQLVKSKWQQKWKRTALDPIAFKSVWENASLSCEGAESMAEQMAAQIELACDASMPRCRYNNKRKPAYWWTTEIADLRKACNKARRKTQRARHRPNYNERHAEYRTRKFHLKKAIRNSKNNCFKEMRDSADDDPWGMAYKTVMRNVRGPRPPQPTCPILLEQIVVALFPPQSSDQEYAVNTSRNVPPVSTDVILQTLKRIKDCKAPGPDGVPNNALKVAIRANPQIFADLYTTCLEEGTFPTRWKLQRLVLLLKPGKQPDHPAAYRPLCMLDTTGKILERIICDRLQEYLESPGGLSDNQFGFRRARSTLDAIRIVTNIAREAISGGHTAMKLCAVITLDIKNAFNSANWSNILLSLENLKIPSYLLSIIRSYFSKRILRYDTDDGPKTYEVTGGVPQGSVLGPTLWNIMYDGVLKLKLPTKTTIVGYADDIALVVVDKRLDHLEAKCNDAATRVQRWLSNAGLELAAQKTEAVLISARKKKATMKLSVGGHEILSKEAIKYLGVMIDTRLSFKQHLAAVNNKAAAVMGALTKILPNIAGPQGERRKLLSTVVDSIILYAAPIWAEAKNIHMREVVRTHRRSALRVSCAYRTVSDDAICVVAGKLPVDIHARELRRLYSEQGAKPTATEKAIERERSMYEWQRRWEESLKGRWTYKLIPHLEQWVKRKHGETDYYLTQILTGHGCFMEYLHRFQLAENPLCPSCPNAIESAEHVAFHCDRFARERAILERVLGHSASPNDIVQDMCSSSAKWVAVRAFAGKIMLRLQFIEWERKAQQQQLQLQLRNGDELFPDRMTTNSDTWVNLSK